jgi:hypothetical protein
VSTAGEISDGLIGLMRAAISDAYYEARNARRTMEQAADDAVAALLPIVRSVDQQARAYGFEIGRGHPLVDVIEETSPENPFVAEVTS